MAKVLLIIIAVLAVIAVVFLLLWRISKAKLKQTENELAYTRKELSESIAAQVKLEATLEIINQNRNQADEKIENLHTGDVLGNALDGLSKH